jgi:hypothetical protein
MCFFISLLLGFGFRQVCGVLAGELNELRLKGEPHDPLGLSPQVNPVDSRDKLAKRERFLPGIGIHAPKNMPVVRGADMG